MGKKRYDPLWEVVGEKVPLQGQELMVDAACPHCHVPLQLRPDLPVGATIICGLCGRGSSVAIGPDGLTLRPA